MADRRTRILCSTLTAGMRHLAAHGLKSLDPRWCFVHRPAELHHAVPGAAVVDLTHLAPRTALAARLQEAARTRGHPLATVEYLKTLKPYIDGTG